MKLFRRIAAIAAAMTMAVSMMAVSASASYSKSYNVNTSSLANIEIKVYYNVFRPAPSAPQVGTFQVSCEYKVVPPAIVDSNTTWKLSGNLALGTGKIVSVNDTRTSIDYSYTYSLSGNSVLAYDLTLDTSSTKYGSVKYGFHDAC